MNPAPPDLDAIFCAAIELDCPEERSAFVARACGDHAGLRQRIEKLLLAHFRAGNFLEQPALMPAEATTEPPGNSETATPPLVEAAVQMLGPYRLLQQIGEGGMGTVYLAEQTAPVRRLVAVKLIKPGMDSKHVVARFEAERQALALMDHPGIARVYDAGATEAGRPYFVMELVEGVPITRFCDEHSLPRRERMGLFVAVCQAVQHAHQKGVIHRDLKPSNVLVARCDGVPVPKVIDFGVAKAVGVELTGQTLVTGLGVVIGTLEYMSPEQAELGRLDMDTRGDVYSLGVLLYELLTGTTPLEASRLRQAGVVEALRLIREEEPLRPSQRLAQGRGERGAQRWEELDWIALKALEKDRDRRYASAGELAADVQRYLAGEPVQAHPPSAWYRFRTFVRRHRASLATLVLLGVVLVGAAAVSAWLAYWAIEAEGLAEQRLHAEQAERVRAQKAEQAERAARQLSQRRLYEARRAQADASLWSGRAGQRFASLEALAEAARLLPELGLGDAERLALRNQTIVVLTRADLRPAPHEEPHAGARSNRLCLDANFTRYVQIKSNVLTIHSRKDGRELLRLPHPGTAGANLRFSADDRFLALTSEVKTQWQTRVWDLSQAEPALKVDVPAARSVDLSSDARRAVVLLTDGSLRVFELPEGKELREIPALPGAPHWVRCQPGGSLAVVLRKVGTEAEAVLVNLETGATADRLTLPRLSLSPPVWHPHGKRLGFICNPDIVLWELTSGKGLLTLRGHQGNLGRIAFNHGGTVLASSGADATIRLWDPPTGRQLVSAPVRGSDLQFDARDQLLAYRGEAQIGYLQVATGRELRLLHGHKGAGPIEMDISPDGRALASAGGDGIRIWDLEQGKQIGYHGGQQWRSVAFNPAEGSLIARGCAPFDLQFNREKDDWPEGGPRGRPVKPTELLARGQFSQPGQSPDRYRVAVSPDGRWLVKGYAEGNMTRTPLLKKQALLAGLRPTLTDRHSGITFPLPGEGEMIQQAQVAVSPDGRRVAVASARNYYFWQTEPLRRHATLPRQAGALAPGPVAFSPDGRMVAVARSPWEVSLLDPETLEEYATLAAPIPEMIGWLCFSPDGHYLTASTLAQQIQVWDLRAIRRQLAEIGLSWEVRPLP